MRFFYLLLLCCTATSGIIAQQAWTRAKGSYYVQVGGSFLQSNSLLNGTEDPILLNRDVSDVTIQGYGEYGLTSKLMISAQLPLKLLSVDNTVGQPNLKDGSLTALSNVQAALTYNFYQKNGWVLSGKTGFSLPTAKFDEATGLRSGFDAFSFTPSLMAGLGRNKFFSSAELGYVLRSNNYSRRIAAAWQIGGFWGKKKQFIPILGIELMRSGKSDFDDSTSKSTGLYLNEQSYLSPNLKIGYKPNPNITLWLSAGGGLGYITRNIAASPGLSFTVSYAN